MRNKMVHTHLNGTYYTDLNKGFTRKVIGELTYKLMKMTMKGIKVL